MGIDKSTQTDFSNCDYYSILKTLYDIYQIIQKKLTQVVVLN